MNDLRHEEVRELRLTLVQERANSFAVVKGTLRTDDARPSTWTFAKDVMFV